MKEGLAAVMQTLRWCIVVKREQSVKAKLSVYWLIYIPTLTYDHELWVVTEIMRSQIQASHMSVLQRAAELSLRDSLRLCSHLRGSHSRPVEVVWLSNNDVS